MKRKQTKYDQQYKDVHPDATWMLLKPWFKVKGVKSAQLTLSMTT